MDHPFVSSQRVDFFVLFMFATLAYLVPLRRQCQASQHDEPNSTRSTGRVLAKIKPFERYCELINRVWPYLFGFIFIKHVIICLLRLDAFKDFRKLDCFLFGRMVFLGRAAVFSETIAIAIITMSTVYRYVLTSSNNYEFLLHEFLLEGYEKAEDDDDATAATKKELQQRWKHYHYSDYLTTRLARRDTLLGLRKQWNETTAGSFSEIRHIKLMNREQHGGGDYIVRLNRTPKAWRFCAKFANLTIYHFCICMAITLIYIFFGSMPTWFNEQGFKLTHRTCVEYIQQQYLETNTTHYEYIMDVRADLTRGQQRGQEHQFAWNTTKTWALVFPWRNLCKLSVYHVIRIGFTLFDNLLITGEFALATEFNVLLVVSITLDVVMNTKLIHARLHRLVAQMNTRHYCSGQAMAAATRSLSPGRILAYYKDDKCQREIDELQVLLADHFVMIARYNPYVSFHALTMTLVFLIIIVWLNVYFRVLGNLLDQFEYIAFMLVFSMLSIMALAIFSYVRLINYNLYRLLCSAVVLDTDPAGSKVRWLRLLSFYKPNPLICFRLFRSNEISFLFCLKMWNLNNNNLQLTSWIISALLVIESFYYYVH